jgi:hypothetical protein
MAKKVCPRSELGARKPLLRAGDTGISSGSRHVWKSDSCFDSRYGECTLSDSLPGRPVFAGNDCMFRQRNGQRIRSSEPEPMLKEGFTFKSSRLLKGQHLTRLLQNPSHKSGAYIF